MKILKKVLKIIGIVVGVIVMLIAAFYLKAYISVEKRLNTKYEVKLQSINIRKDSAALALGAHLVVVKGCTDCHSADLGGKIFVDDPGLGLLPSANLTKGKGGRPQSYTGQDWLLALKHGIHRDGTPLVFMPSHEFTLLSEDDLTAIIAFCSNTTPVDRMIPEKNLGPLAYILTELGKLPLIPAEMIDHSRTLVKSVRAEISVEYGKYLSTSCQGCHRVDMKGGDPVAPGFPPVADISSTGHPGKWSDDQFIETLRTGTTPEGKKLKPEEMPWTTTKQFTEVELKALHLYLKTL